MPQTITTGYQALVDAAEREIETLPIEQARQACRPRRRRAGRYPRHPRTAARRQGARRLPLPARHAGVLDRPGRAPITSRSSAQDKKFVFFCAGGLRSALAAQTAQRMGLKPVAHIKGGFGAWKKAGGPVEAPAEPKKPEPFIAACSARSATFGLSVAHAPQSARNRGASAMALKLIIGNKNYSSWSLRPWIAMKVAGIAVRRRR